MWDILVARGDVEQGCGVLSSFAGCLATLFVCYSGTIVAGSCRVPRWVGFVLGLAQGSRFPPPDPAGVMHTRYVLYFTTRAPLRTRLRSRLYIFTRRVVLFVLIDFPPCRTVLLYYFKVYHLDYCTYGITGDHSK